LEPFEKKDLYNIIGEHNRVGGGYTTKKKIFLMLMLGIMFLIAVSSVIAADERVIANSADWTDVYSAIIYANLNEYTSYFLTSPKHATILPFEIPKTVDGLQIISSRSNPYASGYKSILEAQGYKNVEDISASNLNLVLGNRLPDITKFIITDNSYGYNAISLAPLAVLGRYYVIFADKSTISQVSSFLANRKVDKLILYGQVDREVKTALTQYNPTIINSGDRFDNNIEIVKRYQQLYTQKYGSPRKQAILSNGEFIEASIMSGADPVLFIGFSNVPDQVKQYISDSQLEVGTLVGNELIGTATYIRRQTGLSVFVKFGQGTRTPQNTISQVEDLDRFPIPRYGLNLNLVTATINTATNNLEVTFQNKAPIATYLQTLSLSLINDNQSFNIPDNNGAIFIDANDYKTVTYELKDADGNTINLNGDNITANLLTVYGESPKSLEQTLTANVSVQKVSVLDEANIDIVKTEYAKSGSKFLVSVKNVGQVDAYVTIEIHNVLVNGESTIFSADNVVKVSPGDTITIPVTTTMTDEDIPNNPKVQVKALYGERENALTKTKQTTFPFKLAAPDITPYIIGALIIILLFLIFSRKKCKHCGHRNVIGRKTCKKCHSKL